MKKLIVSFMLVVFIFSAFYPAIYATENIIANETQEVKEEETAEEVAQNTVQEEPETNPEENVVANMATEENQIADEIEQLEESSVKVEDTEVIENKVENAINEVKEEKENILHVETNVNAAITGKMYIEKPNQNQTVTLPNSNIIDVEGWAVSTEKNAVLKVYINDKFIKNVEHRTVRDDVDLIVSPEFGGTTNTPKAGFKVALDITALPAGNNTIKIEQVSSNGQIICSDAKTIQIKQTQYTGKMYMENFPLLTYTLPNSNTMNLFGWAVSDDAGAYLIVEIDGKQYTSSTTRTKRSDVDSTVSPNYGGTVNTPKAGFSINVNISNLAKGMHKVIVSEVSRYDKIMASVSVQLKIETTKYNGKMYIETPTNYQTFTLPNSNNLTVKGWAVAGDKNAILKVYIDNKYVKNIEKRVTRGDVNTSVSPEFGGTTNTPKAGFETNLDISTLTAGMHKIKIEQVSRYGELICQDEKTIQITHVQFKGKMNLETFPVLTYSLPDSPIMNLFGWAVSDDAGAYMIVQIDGKQYACSTTRTKRTDVDSAVSPNYGGTASTPKAGFSINVDIRNLHEGVHTVVVSEVSRYNKIMASSEMKVKVVTPNYTGMLNIESPIKNKRYPSGWLEVKGWALTEVSGDFIKVYLDGKYQTIAQATERTDVLGVHGAKYPNHNQYAGFISNINTSGLGEGTHTIKIEHCSRYGKTIEVAEIPFTISNTTTWGIDVSHYQGTIDWNAVRNQGVNFAILKIGEYRESSGRIIVDSRFNEYYTMCKQLGIAVGGYFYSYAFDPNEASHEASACLQIIQGKSFEMPIFLDIEDDIIRNAVNSGRTSRDALTNGAITFCQIMNQNGHKAGVYANKNFLTNYLNASVLEQYNIWLAHYVASSDYSGRYDMWQYTSSGSIPGINGPVDLDWCFRRYY